jgi:hypothetical protein
VTGVADAGEEGGPSDADAGTSPDGALDGSTEGDAVADGTASVDGAPQDGAGADGAAPDAGADGGLRDGAADGPAPDGSWEGGAPDASANCVSALFGAYLLRSDGKLLWEGAATSTTQTSIVDASSGLALTDVKDVQDGASHGCASLATAKTAVCWRTAANGNAYGQLGGGTMDSSGPLYRATPVLTAAGKPLTDVVAVATGESNGACAVTGDGKLYCWGDLSWLANFGTAQPSPYARAITTNGTTALAGVTQASIGYSHACALLQAASGKEVWCWGYNGTEALGLGDTMSRQYPTKVAGFTTPSGLAVQPYASGYYESTCALDGQNVRCWGYNNVGQTGVGSTTTPIHAPTLVTFQEGGGPPLDGVLGVNTGGTKVCALRSDQTLWCWGTGYKDYASNYGAAGVIAMGSASDPRFATADGVYHVGTTPRVPNCGPLP